MIIRTNIAYNPLDSKDLPRHIYVHQAALQHLHRIQFHRGPVSAPIWNLVEDLMTLSLHPYTQIRVSAQEKFALAVMRYQLPRAVLANRILDIWTDNSLPECRIIGSTFLLSMESIIYMIFESWELFKKFFICIFSVHKHTSHKLQNVIAGALILYEHCMFPLPIVILTDPDSPASKQKTEQNRKNYQEIISYVSQNALGLSWSFQDRLLHYLYHLMTFARKQPPSVELCQYLLKSLKSDVIAIRASAAEVMSQLLVNIKIKRPRKVITNELQVSRIDLVQEEFQCDFEPQPNTAYDWESFPFIDCNYYGWNGKTKERKIYLPLSPENHELRKKMFAGAIPYDEYALHCKEMEINPDIQIYECRKFLASHFTSLEYWKSVIASWSNEIRPDDEASDYWTFFQLCFSQFPEMMEAIAPLLDVLASEEEHLEPQALAADITAGLIRGTKHWSFDEIQNMITKVQPLIDRSLCNPHFKFWRDLMYYSVSTSDYHRVDWIYQYLYDKIIKSMEKPSHSLQITHTFEYMAAVFSCLTWRAGTLSLKLIQLLLPGNYLYEAPLLVRGAIGDLLQVCISILYRGTRDPSTNVPVLTTPSIQHFIPGSEKVLDIICETADKIMVKKLSKLTAPLDEDELSKQNRFIHCVLMMILPSGENIMGKLIPLIFPLFPVVLSLVDDRQPEIATVAWKVTGVFANSEFDSDWMLRLFNIAIDILMDRFNLRQFSPDKEVPSEILNCSWRVRCSTLTFLHGFISQNMFFLTPDRIHQVLDCLYFCLIHPQIEVRNTAGSTLSSVLRFIPEEQQIELWDTYATEATIPLPPTSSVEFKDKIILRHRAILGMAAIVNVHPYDMPNWLPTRLVEFATHIHDPVPIKVSSYYFNSINHHANFSCRVR